MDGGRGGGKDGLMAGWMDGWMDVSITHIFSSQLEQLQNMLTEGSTTVSSLQSQYHWLLYISGARVSMIYDLLRCRPPPLHQIVKEVVFLSPHINDSKKLKASIAVSMLLTLGVYAQ